MHLRKKWEFSCLKKHGSKFYGRALCFQFEQSQENFSKIGVTVSRKYGNAVKRNIFKRRVKEIFRINHDDFPVNIHLNILPLKQAKNLGFDEYTIDFINFMKYLKSKAQDLEALV